MKVTNTYSIELPLPNGKAVPAESTISVPDEEWESVKNGDNVKIWLGTGVLKAESDDAPKARASDPRKGS